MRVVVLVLFIVAFAPACDRYKHVLTTIERVDDPEDALNVYHDKGRGVTCYQLQVLNSALACVPDVMLEHRTASLKDASP